MKACNRCGVDKAPSEYRLSDGTGDGRRGVCKACEAKHDRERRAQARTQRLASDFDALKVEDFDVGVGNDGRRDPNADREKKQEFSKAMGEFSSALHVSEGDPDQIPEHLGTYVGRLAEQERRWGNRRLGRSVSLIAAHEALQLRLFKDAAREFLSDRIAPTGYALKTASRALARSVVLLLSDLHFGAELSDVDNPMPYRAIEESRRFEFIVRETIEFKSRYRDQSELVLLLNGDLIDGNLGHDLRDGAPLTEQKVIFWRYMSAAIGLFAQNFPRVRVICQPGNHGRDIVRHPGRATSSKWDGHEWQMYYALSMMASGLPNVTFEIPRRAVSLVELHGSWLLLTHGDTEMKLGHPMRKAESNRIEFAKINATEIYGRRIDVFAHGHYHEPLVTPCEIGVVPGVVSNGMLVPPNGYARTAGYIMSPCGQYLWEAVEGFPLGDARFLAVGRAQDGDERLGSLIPPFRLPR